MSMLLSPTGWAARYEQTRGGPDLLPVERFDDEGNALVVHPESGFLGPVRNISIGRFVELTRCSRTVTVLPASPGWSVVGLRSDEDTAWTEPVIAWLVDDTGEGTPIVPVHGDSHQLTTLVASTGEPLLLRGPGHGDVVRQQ